MNASTAAAADTRWLEEVAVSAAARLHLGFLDLDGGLGRRFGSLGVTIEGIGTRLTLKTGPGRGSRLVATGPSGLRAARYLARLAEHCGIVRPLELVLHEAIPEHAGLGSGTQLALSIGAALSRLAGQPLAPATIANLLERGGRSGIGLGAFEQGGLLLDGGRATADESAPPPIIARHPYPESWRILLILDPARQGLHGAREREAFQALKPFPAERAGHLCRLVLMVALPALIERDHERFAQAIAELQRTIGDYFAAAQGGAIASPDVAEVLRWAQAQGLAGIGQSSWGPTGFILIAESAAGEALASEATRRFGARGLHFKLCSGANDGAAVEAVRHPRAFKDLGSA